MGISNNRFKRNNGFKAFRWPWINRKYKDTVFRLLFNSDKAALLDLYNALNNSFYTDPDALIVNTLDTAIFMGMHNDLSFILDTHLNIYEHQSTKCPNIPLRCLFYVGKLYAQLINEEQLYSEKRIKIPTPHFVVFYNGVDTLPEEMTYKLSEMYEEKTDNPELELTIKILNINYGMNETLMRGCKMLNDYSIFVSKEREFYKESRSHEKAVNQAIDYCIENDILKDFLVKEGRAVYMYSLSEYNQTAHLKAVKEESFEEGIAIGEERGIAIGEERGIAIGEERGIAIGEERGIAIGRDDGIRIFIEDKLEDNVPENSIIEKLMSKYKLTQNEAQSYIDKCK